MHSNVIYLAWQPAQCKIADIMLTNLGHGYTEAAGGFSQYPAGCSNKCDRISTKYCQLFENLVADRTDLSLNLDNDVAIVRRKIAQHDETVRTMQQILLTEEARLTTRLINRRIQSCRLGSPPS